MNQACVLFVCFFQFVIISAEREGPIPDCPKHTVYLDCAPACPQTCDWYNKTCTLPSPKISIPGCYCEDGYVRQNNKCYRGARVCCQENEVYDRQDPVCEKNCYNYKEECHRTDRNAVKGCYCLENFVRNKNGMCVAQEECSSNKCNRLNEVFENCPTGGIKTCDYPDGEGNPETLKCKPQCVCKDGYVRDSNNDCILQTDCPVTCESNEVYSNCGYDVICNKEKVSEECEAGCFCRPGYKRATEGGKCIPKSDCAISKCRANEEYLKCGPSCPQTCEWLNRDCTLFGPRCHPGCYCKNGYVRENNDCVEGEKVCCPAHEVYSLMCPSCEKTCSNPSGTCTETSQTYGCYCEDGYVRDEATGTCIPQSKCPPPSCKKYEVYMECGPNCPQTCEYFYTPCEFTTDICVPGCFCQEGYVRINNECVPGTKVCCPENEVSKYSNPSCEKTCDNLNGKCSGTKKTQGCYCADQYVRDTTTGTCIPKSKCPTKQPTCKKYEVYMECGPNCPQTCEYFYTPCEITTAICMSGCFCQEGYVRINNECVPGNKECCPENEVSKYSNPSCEKTCDNLNGKCSGTKKTQGCYCADQYVRDTTTGRCIPKSKCPPQQPKCNKNEVYMECGPNCPQTCEYFYTPCEFTIDICMSGCFCQEGYVRINNECVPGNKECCPENEVSKYSNPSCEKTCDNLNGKCSGMKKTQGCYCADQYVRDTTTGTCIPKSKCPPQQPTCKKNEVYSECGPTCPQTCEYFYTPCIFTLNICRAGCFCEDGYVRINKECVDGNEVCCPENEVSNYSDLWCDKTCNDLEKCKPGKDHIKQCFCIDGYVRNETGSCIPSSDCPINTCETELEEYNPCTETCTKTCSNPTGSGDCETGIAECVCIDGYLRDEYQNCVLPQKCPKKYVPEEKCGKNEHYGECEIDNTCDKTNMATECCSGCFCNDGYARNEKTDKCVLESQCESKKNCPPNEVYLKCGSACPKTCKNSSNQQACIEICVEGCFCRNGMLRNKQGICVKKSEC